MKTKVTVIISVLILIILAIVFSNDDTKEKGKEIKENVKSFLQEQEAAIIKGESRVVEIKKTGVQFVEVNNSCDHNYENGECVIVYSEPSTESSEVTKLRQGMVLRVGGEVERNDVKWYRITFDNQYLHYPERIESNWYVQADKVNILYDEGTKTSWEDGEAKTNKRIVVDRSEEKLYAYEGDELFMEAAISTGIELSPTPLGSYEVFKKMPSRYMQGPIPSIPNSDYYDLQGVPWNLYFTEDGAVVHGAYWHESFGSPYSHGCVNMPPNKAKVLYNWAPLGTKVIIQD